MAPTLDSRTQHRRCSPVCAPATRWPRAFAVMLLLVTAGAALADEAPHETPAGYQQLWDDPRVVRRINEGIETHRKSDAILTVVGADGTVVSDSGIEIVQTTHDFLFGCNLFFLNGYESDAENRKYEARFAELFNFGSAPFYWSDLEPEPGKPRFAKNSPPIYRRPPPDLAVEFAKKHSITLKGHPLMWNHFYPAWLPKDKDQVAKAISAHMAEIAERYADTIRIWDVVNETLNAPRPEIVLPDDYVAFCFNEADRLFPANHTLLANETREAAHHWRGDDGTDSRYYRMLAELKARNIRFDGIGFQFHCADTGKILAGTEYTPEFLFKIYDLYSRFERPLYITELSVGTAGEGTSGQPVQAEVVRNFYRLFFSIERMAGITWWNLADGTAHKWNEIRDGKRYVHDENRWQAGLLDRALNPKEAYRVLERLIHDEWRTRTVGRTDTAGQFTFRGFHGRYQITVRAGEKSKTFDVHVAKDGPAQHRLVLDEQE
ncbi:MAG: endo-1,4-beta-xylanase [Phycisphaerae bacterium]|nr:endo-1,4-beta-xylanase [Phycisphaerae bacterium]